MITTQQIKAARALLDWNQSDLADASGLSLAAVNNLERGIGSPRVETMGAIEHALKMAGIEFIGTDGVRRLSEPFEMYKYEGPDFNTKLNDDMLGNLSYGDEVLMCGINERLFAENDPVQLKRYTDAAIEQKWRERILICEGDTFLASQPEAYRWISRDLFGKVPYLIYGDRMAVVMWQNPGRTIIIHNKSWVDTFRAQFEFLWANSKPCNADATNINP